MMPQGAATKYSHSELTKCIGEFVSCRNVGEMFTIEDIIDYLRVIPLRKYKKNGTLYSPQKRKRKTTGSINRTIGKKGLLRQSRYYFAQILAINARKWNIRYGMLHSPQTRTPKDAQGRQQSIYQTTAMVVYCKTDSIGSWECMLCGHPLQLKPQWYYMMKTNTIQGVRRCKIIRQDIQCADCYELFDVIMIDHKRMGSRYSTHWKLKGEEDE